MFVLAFNNSTFNVPNDPINNANSRVLRDNHIRYFHSIVDITNYNVLIDDRNIYDQPINDSIKQYNDIRKPATGQGKDYTKGVLLDYQYFKDHYNLIAVDLSKQKELDADLRVLEFYKGTAKVM